MRRTLAWSPRAFAWPFALAALLGGGPAGAQLPPAHDKVVVVILENKSYDQVRVQPYTASLLAGGATFSAAPDTTRRCGTAARRPRLHRRAA